MPKYFHQLDPDSIKDFTILLDIDGTIACDAENRVSFETRSIIQELKKYNDIYLVSNNFDSSRTLNFGQDLELKVLQSGYKKPRRSVIRDLQTKKPILVIGDKYLTDDLFASRIGARYLRVRRLRSKNDRSLIKASYVLDNIVYFFVSFRKREK